MKRNFVRFICSIILSLTAVVAAQNDKQSFRLVHWNVLKTMYEANSFIYNNESSIAKQISNTTFKTIVTKTSTPDSYTSIFDQNTTFYIHPNHTLLGIKLTSLKETDALNLVKKAINKNQCVRGFYTWIDDQEKYMVICPLIGKTKDGHKLYYAYTMYTRSMPEYYLKTLKNSELD